MRFRFMLRIARACALAAAVVIAAAPAEAETTLNEQGLRDLIRKYDGEMADRIDQKSDSLEEAKKDGLSPEEEAYRNKRIVDEELDTLKGKRPATRGERQRIEELKILLEALKRLRAMPGQAPGTSDALVEIEKFLRSKSQKLADLYWREIERLSSIDASREAIREHDERRAYEEEQKKKREAEADGKKTTMGPTSGDPAFAMAAAAILGEWRGPVQIHMGFENALNERTFAIEGQERGDGFTGFDGHATATLGRAGALHFGVNTYDVSFTGAREMIDPLGQRLLFPGVTSGGYVLVSGVAEGTPGGLNVVENLRYAYEHDSTTFYAAYAMACDYGRTEVIGYGGLAHTIAEYRRSLTGDIPDYAIGFAYDTRFDVDVTRVMGGVRAVRNFDLWPGFSLNAGATAFLNFADAEGEDRLQLGVVNEAARIGASETTFGWAAGFGAELKLGDSTTLFANYRYIEDKTAPIAVRHDDDPSHVEFERASAHTATLGLRFTF